VETSKPSAIRPNDIRYFASFSSYKRLTWLWSGLAAAGLNLLLFLLMPHLMHPAPSQPAVETLIPRVNLAPLKRPRPEIKPEPVSPPAKPRPEPPEPPRPASQPPPKPELTLAFEINPRLPSGPTTVDLPPLKSVPLVSLAALPDVFSEGQLDAPLSVLARMPPIYPRWARRRGIEGWVTVRFGVNAQGRVEDVTILEAQPSKVFEQSVKRAVSKWRFKPGTVGGMPVRTRVETTIRFEME
jgi:protein TonB